MTWLWVILVVAVIGGIIGWLFSDKEDNGFLSGFLGAGFGCGYIILQIFLAILGLWLVLKLGSWLFS